MTARHCISEDAKPEDFRRPGHMFPLLAKKNGVLERDGHTEATVDLMRLAGLKECGLCCEIMREDGTMMRTTELMELAEEWNICFITIAAIIEYRKKYDRLVERAAVAKLPTKYGEFKAYGYQNILNGNAIRMHAAPGIQVQTAVCRQPWTVGMSGRQIAVMLFCPVI